MVHLRNNEKYNSEQGQKMQAVPRLEANKKEDKPDCGAPKFGD